jgi:hypothetical protein
MVTYGGAQHAFTVFGGNRYQETADKILEALYGIPCRYVEKLKQIPLSLSHQKTG